MPGIYKNNGQEVRHTDEMQNIINSAPYWLLRWGITIFLVIIAMIVALSAFIKFPDIVRSQLKITAQGISPYAKQLVGIINISQNNIRKVKEGQEVLAKLKAYPFEKYGMLRGKIKFISNDLSKDSTYTAIVNFKIQNLTDLKQPVHLSNGMIADAEIITQNTTVLQRITESLFKISD